MDGAARTICVVTAWPLRDGWERSFLERALLKEGIYAHETIWLTLLPERPYAGILARAGAPLLSRGRDFVRDEIRRIRPAVTLCCGSGASDALTGKSEIDKWQCSVLRTEEYGPVIPCYPADRVAQDLSLQLWVALCAKKCSDILRNGFKEQPHTYLLNPPLEETLAFLTDKVRRADKISVDIETGRGQINTIGFAISPYEAIAINVLPDRLSAAPFHKLWSLITEILEGDQPKILQNFIYETLFLSRYGIRLSAVTHDTMVCQKFLWPEFEMGLHAIGRMYTDMPYWKEDGKSWNNIRDWERHYEYNCKDTCGTFAGYLGQRIDLDRRGLTDLHDNYLRRLYSPISEMCSWGIPISEGRLLTLRAEVESEYSTVLKELQLGAPGLNPRSPIQLKAFLKDKGYTIPKKYDSATKTRKESTDEKSLKKLRMKHPKDESLSQLLRLSKLGKASSSYLNFTYEGGRMRYMLNAHGTETGRFSGSKDPWDNGVNPQTVPGGGKGINIKKVFECAPGNVFLQLDLRQAESRFVAYDSADLNLIMTLEDPLRDVHSETAVEICRALGKDPEAERKLPSWKKTWRQLGKKSGHAANYCVKETTFIDACIAEMDMVLTQTEATKVLESYHKLFPGIRRWHSDIRRELVQTRCLRTPLGRERVFWGRLDDDTFREAYAYKPQSTIPDITNHLMLWLLDRRLVGDLPPFRLLLQCHDSLLLECPVGSVDAIVSAQARIEEWHPRITLSGGRLMIPTEAEVGRNWGELEPY